MSSILYSADQEMMDFHRLNGQREINFWRPSSQNNIRDLRKGDYIFFYSYMNYGTKLTKGIVGYGKYVDSHHMTVDQMWKQYKEKNGFSTKESWLKAMDKYTGDNKAKKIQSLVVKDILFFNQPIMLENLETNINPNIESYVYINNKGMKDGTFEILEHAKLVGIDWWTASLSDTPIDENQFEKDLKYAKVCDIHRKIQDISYEGNEIKRNHAIESAYKKESLQRISGSEYELVEVTDQKVSVYIPLSLQSRKNSKLKMALGHILLWKHLCSKEFENFEIHCVTEGQYGKELWSWIKDPVIVLENIEEANPNE